MNNAKKQVAAQISDANNVLIAVSRDPSVDQLSAAIGLALFLNKLNKHATAVFSGAVPQAIEFLEPGKTLEKNTDSLRDFIISLDKSKADKLRYKLEDDHVKIFITPYRTSISQDDLNFGQGDFNVDVVVALGVRVKDDLDNAITAQGRILHDAVVMSMSLEPATDLGSIHWVNESASSLCEMVADLAAELKEDGLDAQIATAMLTGVVAETARFSNEKTTASTMSISARLLAAGANQQLVADSLQPKPAPEPEVVPEDAPADQVNDVDAQEGESQDDADDFADSLVLPAIQPDNKPSDGSLVISHDLMDDSAEEEPEAEQPAFEQIHINEQGELQPLQQPAESAVLPGIVTDPPRIIIQPPTLGGTLTANSQPEGLGESSDPLSQSTQSGPLLSHGATVDSAHSENAPAVPAAFDPMAYIVDPVKPIATSADKPAQPQPESPKEDAPTLVVPLSAADTQKPEATPPTTPSPANLTDVLSNSSSGDTQTLEALEEAVHSPHSADDKPEGSEHLQSPVIPSVPTVSEQHPATPAPGEPMNQDTLVAPLTGSSTTVPTAPPPPVPPPLMPNMSAMIPPAPLPPTPQNPLGI